MEDSRKVVAWMIAYLRGQLQLGGLNEEGREGVEVAIQCLESAYDITPNESGGDFGKPPELLSLEEQFAPHQTFRELPAAVKAEAERLKNEGNSYMGTQKYAEAYSCYTRAIDMDCCNAVYFCNRAAASSKMNDHLNAIEDCKTALSLDPSYSKSYGRLGLAYTNLNRHQEAYESYKKAVELEPENESYRNNLTLTEEKLNIRPPGAVFDLSSVFTNPALLNMASQMLSNPSMQTMMGNILSGSVNSSGSGMDALLQAGQQLAAQMENENPDLVESLRRQMGENQPSPDTKKNE